MLHFLTQPWPWYISGPLIGLMVPLLLLLGNKAFGISSSFRHVCAACIGPGVKFFNYNWKAESWNIIFVAGITIGGVIAGYFFQNPGPIHLSEKATADMNKIGISDVSGFMPLEVFSFKSLLTLRGLIVMVAGGFLIGFGTRYANGCTAGHSIMGLANLQWPSLVSTICFFAGGLIMSWVILPLIMKL